MDNESMLNDLSRERDQLKATLKLYREALRNASELGFTIPHEIMKQLGPFYTNQHFKELASSYNQLLPVLYQITTRIKAKTIIELGTGTGECTIPLAEAARETGGHVWTVDYNETDEAKKRLEEYNLNLYVTFIKEDVLKYGESYDPGAYGPIDHLIIDLSHVYENTDRELDLFIPKMRTDGVISLLNAHAEGVIGPVKRRITEHVGGYELTYHQIQCGLAEVRKAY